MFDNLKLGGTSNVAETFDLSAFDAATGATTVPAGNYVCRIAQGELVTTRAGKDAYRIRFEVVEPKEHYGLSLWRYFTFSTPASANYAKRALAPLGLTSSAKLREPYPPFGTDVYCECLVSLREGLNGPSNDVVRFTPCAAPASALNPFAVSLDDEKVEGGLGS